MLKKAPSRINSTPSIKARLLGVLMLTLTGCNKLDKTESPISTPVEYSPTAYYVGENGESGISTETSLNATPEHPYAAKSTRWYLFSPQCSPIESALPPIESRLLDPDMAACVDDAVHLVTCGDRLLREQVNCLELWRQECIKLVDGGDAGAVDRICVNPVNFYIDRMNGPLKHDYSKSPESYSVGD